MKRIITAGVALVALLARISTAATAETYTKTGSGAANPEITLGAGDLTGIAGSFSSVLVGDERATRFQTSIPDIFQIYLLGGGGFSATTANEATTLFDTRLYLFDASWRGVYYNDDESDTFSARSTLPGVTPLTPLTPGLYYLAVAPWGLVPQSAGGAIFPDVASTPGYSFFDVAGPTGPGGASPLTGWTGAADTVETGTYQINITGARFAVIAPQAAIPEPGTLVLLLAGAVVPLALLRRRRRAALPVALALMFCLSAGAGAQSEVNTIRAIKTVRSGVEIELTSTREFGSRDDAVILTIGAKQFGLSRPPADGSLGTLIFLLKPEEWAGVQTGDRVTVAYGTDDARDRWDFGTLDKTRLDR